MCVPNANTGLACAACTSQKLGCKPKAQWALVRHAELKAEKAAALAQQVAQHAEQEVGKAAKKPADTAKPSEPSKAKGKRRNMVGEYWFCSHPKCADAL